MSAWRPDRARLSAAHATVGLLIGVMLATTLAGCGGGVSRSSTRGSAPPVRRHLSPYARARADVCDAAARAIVARFLRRAPTEVMTHRRHDNAGAPECVFRASVGGGTAVVSLSVDGSPQPYGVLERRGEEEAQIFGPRRLQAAPVTIFHLGLTAFWFPAEQQLQTTDAVNLITVSCLHCPGASQRRRRAFGIALARRFLGPSQPQLAGSDG